MQKPVTLVADGAVRKAHVVKEAKPKAAVKPKPEVVIEISPDTDEAMNGRTESKKNRKKKVNTMSSVLTARSKVKGSPNLIVSHLSKFLDNSVLLFCSKFLHVRLLAELLIKSKIPFLISMHQMLVISLLLWTMSRICTSFINFLRLIFHSIPVSYTHLTLPTIYSV